MSIGTGASTGATPTGDNAIRNAPPRAHSPPSAGHILESPKSSGVDQRDSVHIKIFALMCAAVHNEDTAHSSRIDRSASNRA